MKKVLGFFMFCLISYATISHAEEPGVQVRTLVKAQDTLTEESADSFVTYRWLIPNLTKGASTSVHYIGIGHNLTNWLYVEGLAGVVARDEKSSTLGRGDIYLHNDWVGLYTFAEYFFRDRALGIYNELDFAFDETHFGGESYSYLSEDDSDLNGYGFGPYLGYNFGSLYLKLGYLFGARPDRNRVLVNLNFSIK